MRLADLEPKWWAEPGRHGQGVVFSRLWGILYGDLDTPAEKGVMRAGAVLPVGDWVIPPGVVWTRVAGDSFDTLTLSPSVDASRAGCWHGFIQAGEAR